MLNTELFTEADECQSELHKWGDGNQVAFDLSKESKHVVSGRTAEGEDFELLGVDFDCELTMVNAIRTTVTEVQWKLRVLERSARYQCATV